VFGRQEVAQSASIVRWEGCGVVGVGFSDGRRLGRGGRFALRGDFISSHNSAFVYQHISLFLHIPLYLCMRVYICGHQCMFVMM
jgi:hypothetical protein